MIQIKVIFINNINMIETLENTLPGHQINSAGAVRARRLATIRQKKGISSRSQTQVAHKQRT